MANERMDNSGAIFKNDRREKDSHPNMTGSAVINGVEYWVSDWTKEGKNGRFQSLSFRPKGEIRGGDQKPRQEAARGQGTGFEDMADDIPF